MLRVPRGPRLYPGRKHLHVAVGRSVTARNPACEGTFWDNQEGARSGPQVQANQLAIGKAGRARTGELAKGPRTEPGGREGSGSQLLGDWGPHPAGLPGLSFPCRPAPPREALVPEAGPHVTESGEEGDTKEAGPGARLDGGAFDPELEGRLPRSRVRSPRVLLLLLLLLRARPGSESSGPPATPTGHAFAQGWGGEPGERAARPRAPRPPRAPPAERAY